MTIKVLSRYYGAQVRIVLAVQQKSLGGTLSPLAAGKSVWPKLMTEGEQILYSDISGFLVRTLTPEEIAAMTYTGDRALAKFFEVTLPGGQGATDFAMMHRVKVMMFAGASEADADPAIEPFVIERIKEGNEGLA